MSRDTESFENETIIRMNWWQKECSSKQILNFHSHHPTSVKRNVVMEFTKHALSVTSPIMYQHTIRNLYKTFRRSSYPPNFIDKILKTTLSKIGNTFTVSSVGEQDENFNFIDELSIRGLNNEITLSTTGNPDETLDICTEFEYRNTVDNDMN